MKRIAIVLALAFFCAASAWAQDNTASSTSNDSNMATQSSNNNSAQSTSNQTEEQQNNARKRAAQAEENAADAEKESAKNADTKQGEDHDKARARLDDAAKDLNQLLAAPDNGIPDDVFAKAKCVAVVPS